MRVQAAVPQQPRHILSESQRLRAIRMPALVRPTAPVPHHHPAYPPNQPVRRPGNPHKSLLGLSLNTWLLVGGLLTVGVFALVMLTISLGAVMIFGSGVLPGVRVAGVNVGGMSLEAAESALTEQWATITVRDEFRTWQVNPSTLGINFDARATAQRAYDQGRGAGNLVAALTGLDVEPVFGLDTAALIAGLSSLTNQVDLAPVNAGVQLVDGQVAPTASQDGRRLDAAAVAQRLQQMGAAEFNDGALDLVMQPVSPQVTDATPLVQAATQLLTSPLTIRVYDPVTGDMVNWQAPPAVWGRWLTAVPDPTSPIGLALSVESAPVRDFLTVQSGIFDPTRYLNIDEAVNAVRDAVAAGSTRPTIRVHHRDRQHTVRAGETIVSIAWDYGVPYPWVQQANPGVNTLSVGQTLTIPSPDNFLPYAVVPDKRIVVSISRQRVWVYENGQMIWDWPASTGIIDSPTWPGVYQILSHELNAYAGNWNLWMPNFMGVYRPIPGADFTNGFHGFPTRGGGQILWENSLGRRVTYGCILLSNANAQRLYDWAETGVVVEIQP